MSRRTSITPRLVALLILPSFLAACTSWQPLRMNDLRATMREYDPDRIQLLVRADSLEGEIVLSNPQLYGDAPMDTIGGILRDVGQVGIPFSDVVGANYPTKRENLAKLALGGAFFALFFGALYFSDTPICC